MIKFCIGVAAAALLAGPTLASVSFNYEKAGVLNTTATFEYSGVEKFDSRELGTGGFTTTFGTSGNPVVITGVYSGVTILDADQYGGAGGTGRYGVTFNSPYTLSLSTSDDSPLTYFGYWLSALDSGNQLEFLKDGVTVATITPSDVITNTGSCPASAHCGNPSGPFAGFNTAQPYVFINIYFDDGDSYDTVRFFEQPTVGGYEFDNHTVGYFLQKGGVVPEPATWAMMIMGFGLVGFAARRRNAMAAKTLA